MDWFFSDPHSNPEIHPDAPAGGPGCGCFERPGPLLEPPSCSAAPHWDSPAGWHFNWHSELPRLVVAERAKAVYHALIGAGAYVPAAVRKATGQELGAIIADIVPGLLMFVGLLAATTALGAVAGGAVGALFAGVGAVPGAVIGAHMGLGAGTAILEYLGLAFLVVYIGAGLLQAADVAADSVRLAWHSQDRRSARSTDIDQASHRLADAVALVFRGVLQGLVAFLLAKGSAAAASRVPELAAKLRASKLGAGFAEWVEKNWARLIEEPRLKGEPVTHRLAPPKKDTGPAVTPSQLRRSVDRDTPVRENPARGERVRAGDAKEATRAPASRKLRFPVETNPNEAFFWSGRTGGVGGEAVARQIAVSQSGTTLEALIENRGIEMPKWDATNPDVVQAWQDISADYANGAAGTVRAVIGESLRPGNIWETSELPALMSNPNVTRIITIDPATKAETVIFMR